MFDVEADFAGFGKQTAVERCAQFGAAHDLGRHEFAVHRTSERVVSASYAFRSHTALNMVVCLEAKPIFPGSSSLAYQPACEPLLKVMTFVAAS